MVLCVVLVLLTSIFDMRLFYISAAIMLCVFAAVLLMLRRVGRDTRGMLEEISQGILHTGDSNQMAFPFPVITIYANNEIVWYNDLCAKTVFRGKDMRGERIGEVLPQVDIARIDPQGNAIEYAGRKYTAYVSRRIQQGDNITVVYLVDDTQLKHYASEYQETRPSIAVIMVDNYEEMLQDYKESERAQLVSEVQYFIEQYISDHNGFMIRIEREKYVAVIEERGMRRMVGAKFDLLDRVRGMGGNHGRMHPTLSMGVGRESETLHETESNARQALDMCLGRGGDQVAVKTQNGYEFYGGLSKGIEKRTKVKTRIIASALSELIASSSNVIIMGHHFADLDCLGSAIGMLRTVQSMNKPAAICIHRTKNLVKPLLDKVLAGSYNETDFVNPENCIELVKHGTLLIVLDTHVPQVLESEPVYRACKTVAVIDHHRKLVNHIANAVIFYHEPYASSACEMVTELVQYFPSRPLIGRLEAEALLSGIMLDTKNFVMRTGVRTFEAAAYLRRLGADTVEVRKLFSSSMEAYQQKTQMVASAVIHNRCAIATTKSSFAGIRMVAPQAADELLTISGVDASFIIFPTEDQINVSARSMGALNVQVIMEKLGGGGHQSMAAAQFAGESLEDVRHKLVACIDDYMVTVSASVKNTVLH